jgi:hypothetical protein
MDVSNISSEIHYPLTENQAHFLKIEFGKSL